MAQCGGRLWVGVLGQALCFLSSSRWLHAAWLVLQLPLPASSHTSSALLLTPPLTLPLTPPLSALAPEDAPLIVPRQTCASDSPPCPHLAPRPTPTPPCWSPPPVLLLQEASLDQPVAGVPGSDPPVLRRPWGGGFCPGVHAASPSSNPQPGLSGCQLPGKGGTGEAFSLCRRLVSMATAQLGSTSVG